MADKDVFGFDELEKAFNRLEKRYPNEADRLLMTHGQAVRERVKQLTPVYKGYQLGGKYPKIPGKLKKSWRLQKVKTYKGGTVRVARIKTSTEYAAPVEVGHRTIKGGSSYIRERTGEVDKRTGRRKTVRRKMNAIERGLKGIKHKGDVEGVFMLSKAVNEAQKSFGYDAQKMLDKMIGEIF